MKRGVLCQQMCEQDIYHVVQTAAVIPPVTDWTVAITIILAALAVLLTALAIFIGIAAVWGFTGIKEDAKKIAIQAAEKKLLEYFEQDELKDRIKSMVGSSKTVGPVAGIVGTPYTEEEEK